MARLGRIGLGARGVLYVLLAYLAFRIAFGHANSGADRRGALQTVARQPFGHAILAAMAAGFGAFALWKLAIAAVGGTARAGTDKPAKRLGALATGVSYGLFCASTLALAMGSSGAGGGDQTEVDVTAKVMQHSFGRVVVGVVGAAVLVTGAVLAWRAFCGKRDVKFGPMSRSTRRVVDGLARVGLTARSIVFAAAGVFVLQAALTFKPDKAKGLDGVLKSFARTPLGPWLLVVISGGLLAFGAYSLAAARYAET